jgi:hypothetical protein
MDKKSILEAIECHMIFGETEEAEKLKLLIKKENEVMMTKNQVFEGTLVAIGWDSLDFINQLSLYTPSDEDILLEGCQGIHRFAPYINQKVRILGDITSTGKDNRKISVKKITKLTKGFTKSERPLRDEYGELLPLDAA